MKKSIDVARAWRDQDYYLSLTDEERASLGAHPAGAVGLQDEVLRTVSGGCCPNESVYLCTPSCTPCPPQLCY